MELKKCPFCGCTAVALYSRDIDSPKKRYFVACSVCGVETPRIYRTHESAVEAWNRRAVE